MTCTQPSSTSLSFTSKHVYKKREPGQLSIEESVKRSRCTHDWAREFPSGPRDNGEYRDVCRLCNATRE